MLDSLRTLLARFVVQHLRRPRSLVVAAYLWLAADTDDTEQKRRCLKAVLEMDPDNARALIALAALRLEKADG